MPLNSLNQTVYFLRRVIEPEYKDDLSPDMSTTSSDVMWLDPDLVDSRESRCARPCFARCLRSRPRLTLHARPTYTSRLFALDFEYEEWASASDTSLHASYLEIVERAVPTTPDSVTTNEESSWLRAALESEPSSRSDRSLPATALSGDGSHAAAAEQYAHYARWLRENLGMEPPSLE